MIKLILFLAIVLILAYFAVSKRLLIATFAKEVQFEMTKVTWPSSEEVTNTTILVGIVTVVMALMCLLTDTVFSWILRVVF